MIKIVNGMNIPVDGICIEASGVLVDESAMTGESDHLLRETFEKCLIRQKEHEEQDKFNEGNKFLQLDKRRRRKQSA